MYSIVVMTALTTAPDAPQFNGYFRDLFHRDSNSCSGCNGCNGCSGGARYSCSGYSCSGTTAYPASCSGCSGCCGSGQSVFGWGLGDRVRSWFEPSNCCGSRSYGCTGASLSCSGYSCSGSCFGSAYSCFGSSTYSYTPVMNGGLSCNGGAFPYPAPPPMFDTFPGTPGVPNIPFAVPDPAPGIGYRPSGSVQPAGALASNAPTARAVVIVKLPADAKLFADGRALNLSGAERKFVSPDLPTDQEFVYRFKAEYERDGETVSVTKKVNVRAGQTALVEFTDLTASKSAPVPPIGTSTAGGADKLDNKGAVPVVPAVKPILQEPVKTEPPIRPAPVVPSIPNGDLPGGDRATITVKLPPGATLYVDDRKAPSAEPVRSFTTPPLPAGREFAYLIKAEVMRDGRPETFTQKVPFRAGERVVVDFTSLGK